MLNLPRGKRAKGDGGSRCRYELRRSSCAVRYLRQSERLTAGMLLRALLSGNVVLFEEALAELSGISIDRVTAYIHDKNISRFTARRVCPTRRIRPSGKRSRQCARRL